MGKVPLDYLAGDGERGFDQLTNPGDRYYGAAFEAPLALLERIPGLEDPRDISLGRNFLTHLFFLVGGVFCYLLVHRLFGSRALALVATVLFLLHPRIYAHSFDNLDFTLAARGARLDGNCVAVARLPDYPIATVRTGQYDGTGRLWTTDFALPDGE